MKSKSMQVMNYITLTSAILFSNPDYDIYDSTEQILYKHR